MSAHDQGGSAFPEVTTTYTRDGAAEVQYVHSEGGMTMRDYFAAKAMQSALSVVLTRSTREAKQDAPELAKFSYVVADAMLKARSA